MTMLAKLMSAAALAGTLAAPAAAQYPYPQPQPYPQVQPYPQPYPPGYQGYGYNNGGGIGAIIDQLLGNRYNVTDRTAVSRCASAAVAQAQAQYMPNGYGQGYNNGYPNQNYPGQGYPGQVYPGYGNNIRVTAITNVERRSSGLRVRGLLSTGRHGYNGYPGQPGYNNGYPGQPYPNQAYANGYANGDLTFRCNVDYRGAVTNVRIERNTGYRPY